MTVDLRIKLSEELLRLAATPPEGVKPEELKEIKGRAHFNLAKDSVVDSWMRAVEPEMPPE